MINRTFTTEDFALMRGDDAVHARMLRILDETAVDMTAEVEDPPPIITRDGIPFITSGNISVIAGQAKARKTFLTTSIAGAFLADDDVMGFSATASDRPMLWIDTEQALPTALKTARRVLRLSGLDPRKNDSRFVMKSVRELAPSDRFKLCDTAIKEYNPVLVIIDGIADLIDDVNDAEASSFLTTWLLNTSSTQKCAIIGVLHYNPGKGLTKLRGHLGSEIERKAETVISVDKDGIDSKVSFPRTRDREIDEFRFFVGHDGLPHLCEGEAPIQDKGLKDLMSKLMPEYPKTVRYTDIIATMTSVGVKDTTAKRRVKLAIASGIIIKNNVGLYYLPKEETDDIPF